MPHAGVVAVIIGVTVATVLYFIFGNNQEQDNQYEYRSRSSYSPRYDTREGDTRDDTTRCCPICLSTLNEHGRYVYILRSCKHEFHKKCIEQWQNQALGSQAYCPVCRSPFKL